MAMLAEPRRKTKWSLNPRGKDWSQDSSKFGQKILEKMGWSSGKGLGANLNGTTEHIKVAYKNDSKGMGFKDNGDQWIEHETQFNSLLKSLEGSENSNDSVEKEEEPKTAGFGFTRFQQSESLTSVSKKEISGVSLEEKSKKSKARVHYHKFTRGKDISKYSAKDLANIFGKKTLATPEPVEAPKLNYGVVKFDQPQEKPGGLSFGIPTTESSQSIADYFKSKMPASYGKSKYKLGSNGVLCSVKENEQENVENGFCGFKMETKDEDSSNVLDNEAGAIVEEDNIKKSKKKKKKSKKSCEEDVDLNVDESKTKKDVEQVNNKPEESEKQKKKKKRKAEELEVEIPVVNISEDEPKKKKKKKSKDSDKVIEQDIVVKKSKKRKAEIEENEENLEKPKEENVVNNEDEPSKPKKKKKKSKKHDL